jgi:hypothetical protein
VLECLDVARKSQRDMIGMHSFNSTTKYISDPFSTECISTGQFKDTSKSKCRFLMCGLFTLFFYGYIFTVLEAILQEVKGRVAATIQYCSHHWDEVNVSWLYLPHGL